MPRGSFEFLWNRITGNVVEGINVHAARAVKQNVGIPVLRMGGFQTASYIREVITEESCDGVSIARPLMANNDLVEMFAQRKDFPD